MLPRPIRCGCLLLLVTLLFAVASERGSGPPDAREKADSGAALANERPKATANLPAKAHQQPAGSPAPVVPDLLAWLKSGKVNGKTIARLAMGEIGHAVGSKKALRFVRELVSAMYSTEDPEIRSAAVACLGQFNEALFNFLNFPVNRDDAIRVLIAVGLENQIPLRSLLESAARGDADARRRAWTALSHKDVYDAPVRSVLARFAAASTRNSTAVIEALEAALADPNSDYEPVATDGPAPSAIVLLETLSIIDRGRLRPLVAGALADAEGQEASIPELIKRLESDDPNVRENAARALGNFGSKAKSAAAALGRHLADENDLVRLCSAYALASIGPEARAAVPDLQRALAGDDPAIRSAASHALAKITPPAGRK